MSSNFTQPPVTLGQIVLWRYDSTSKPSPAIVNQVGDRNLSLSIFTPDSSTPLLRNGVYHVSDPLGRREGNIDAGVWDYRDEDKAKSALVKK